MSITLHYYADRASADARWGIGVYFTDMDPYNFIAEQVAFNNWL